MGIINTFKTTLDNINGATWINNVKIEGTVNSVYTGSGNISVTGDVTAISTSSGDVKTLKVGYKQ